MRNGIFFLVLLHLSLPSLAAGGNSTSDAAPISQDALAQLLNRTQGGTVKFIEHQYRRVLKQPIELQGELQFAPPATFIRRVLMPQAEEYRIADNLLSITLPDKKVRQISLRNQPLLRGLMLGFQAVLSGRLNELQPVYSLQLSGTTGNWQVLLQPQDAQLARYIRQILISGHHDQPAKFEVTEVTGDRTVTTLVAEHD